MRKKLNNISELEISEDWVGNNVAFTCPECGKVFIISGLIHKGKRTCPKCNKSIGLIKGGRKSNGSAEIVWDINKRPEKELPYQKSYVVFLDVLGFKDLVLSSRLEDKRKIESYFEIVNSAINDLRSIPVKNKIGIGYIIISDSVILSIKQETSKENNLNILRHLCIAVGKIQNRLALNNIWIRGAISSGNAFFSEELNQVVGPAFIDAYKLEKELAIYPRVILDSKIINELGYFKARDFIYAINKTAEGGIDYSNWKQSILFRWCDSINDSPGFIANDVPLFIDYLSQFFQDGRAQLNIIIENIEKMIYTKTSTYKKYRWIVDYMRTIAMREKNEGNLTDSPAIHKLTRL